MTSKQFKRARDDLGLSQIEMADALGVKVRQIGRRENGDVLIKHETKLAVEYLLAVQDGLVDPI